MKFMPLRPCILGALVLVVLLISSPACTHAKEDVVEMAVDVDGNYDSDHVSSRLARLQARLKAARGTDSSFNTQNETVTNISESNDDAVSNDSVNVGSGNVALLLALGRVAHQVPTPTGKRVAVGWNANVDLIVSGCDLVRRDFPSPNPRDVQKITSLADFADSFAYWFTKGAAAERFVETAELFQEIVELAQSQSQRVEYKTGGNAALMATALAGQSCQCQVLLGGLVGPQLRALLAPSISTVAAHTEGESSTDAIHLILEYSRGEVWGDVTTPRHNRFIVVHDEYNANMVGLEGLAEQVQEEEPFDVFVASGLNQLEGLEPATRNSRLSAVASHLQDLTIPVHVCKYTL